MKFGDGILVFSRIWKIARNLFFVAIFLIVLLFVAEGMLRVAGIDPSAERLVVYQFDDILGWRPRSDFKYYRSTLYYGNFNYYNADGLPTDHSRWHDHASTTQSSIAILGSSFAESYYVPYEQSFPYQIERQMQGKQVLNFGVSGYSPDQELLRAREELPKYNVSDIVLIFFPYRDLSGIMSDNNDGSKKPLFGETFEHPLNTPLSVSEPRKTEENFSAYIRHSALYTLLRPYIRKQAGGVMVDGGSVGAYDVGQMERMMTYFEEIKKEHPSARLFIYEVPHYKEMSDPVLYQRNLSIYMTACTHRTFVCLSMDSIISAHPNVPDIFIVGDGHVTAYGSRLVANSIVSVLKSYH